MHVMSCISWMKHYSYGHERNINYFILSTITWLCCVGRRRLSWRRRRMNIIMQTGTILHVSLPIIMQTTTILHM